MDPTGEMHRLSTAHPVQIYELQGLSASDTGHHTAAPLHHQASYVVPSMGGAPAVFLPDALVLGDLPTAVAPITNLICGGTDMTHAPVVCPQSGDHLEVFSKVNAAISLEFLACLSLRLDDVLRRIQRESKVTVGFSHDEKSYVVQGTFEEVSKCKQELELLLEEIQVEDTPDTEQDMAARDLSVSENEDDQEDLSNPALPQTRDDSPKSSQSFCRKSKQPEILEKLLKGQKIKKKKRKEEDRTGKGKDGRNKDNQVYVSITLDAKGNMVPGSATRESEERSNHKSSKAKLEQKIRKNYELLSPFKFFCQKCSFKTKRESHFHKHMKLHEKLSTLYQCDKCNFTTIRLGHLRRHCLDHSASTHKCDQCSYETDEAKFLIRHKRIKHGRKIVKQRNVRLYECNECHYSTGKLSYFKRHLRVHGYDRTSGECRIHQCPQCGYHTTRKEHYMRHVSNVHINKRPYLCDYCGKSFKRTDALKQHRITHIELDPRTTVFNCNDCGKCCRSHAQLMEHTSVHSNVRSFLCEICGASFKTRSSQRKHVLTIHKNPRAHECGQCTKRFNTSYALRRHMKKHGEEADAETKGLEEEMHQDSHHEVFLIEEDEDMHQKYDESRGEACNTDNVQQEEHDIPVSLTHLLPEDGMTLQIPESYDQQSMRSVAIQTTETTTALLYLTNTLP